MVVHLKQLVLAINNAQIYKKIESILQLLVQILHYLIWEYKIKLHLQ